MRVRFRFGVFSSLLVSALAVHFVSACGSSNDGAAAGSPPCLTCATDGGTLPDGGAFPPSGTLDTSFAGGKGYAELDFPSSVTASEFPEYFGRLETMHDGSLVIVARTTGPEGITVGRFTSEGVAVDGFADHGVLLVPHGNTTDFAVDGDDGILFAGIDAQLGFVARYDQSGKLDATYGQGGVASISFGDGATSLFRILPLPGGQALVFGNLSPTGGSGDTSYIARVDAKGNLDASFGVKPFAFAVATSAASDGTFVAVVEEAGTATLRFFTANGDANAAFGSPLTLGTLKDSIAGVSFDGHEAVVGWAANEDGGTRIHVARRGGGAPDTMVDVNADAFGPTLTTALPVLGGKTFVGGPGYMDRDVPWAKELQQDGGEDPVFAANALGAGDGGAIGPGGSITKSGIIEIIAAKNDALGRVLVVGLHHSYGSLQLMRIYP